MWSQSEPAVPSLSEIDLQAESSLVEDELAAEDATPAVEEETTASPVENLEESLPVRPSPSPRRRASCC